MIGESIELLRKVKYIPLGDKPAEITESSLFQDMYTLCPSLSQSIQ